MEMLTLLFGGFLEHFAKKNMWEISQFLPQKCKIPVKTSKFIFLPPKSKMQSYFFPHNLGVKHGKYTSLAANVSSFLLFTEWNYIYRVYEKNVRCFTFTCILYNFYPIFKNKPVLKTLVIQDYRNNVCRYKFITHYHSINHPF